MKQHYIYPMEYGFNAAEALSLRLGESRAVTAGENGAAIAATASAGAEERLCEALSDILTREAVACELAREIAALPLSAAMKQRLLPEAARLVLRATAGGGKTAAKLSAALLEHFSRSETLNLPGYMRFRMRETLAACQIATAKAADAAVLSGEYSNMLSALAEYAGTQPARTGEIAVVLNADGSCTLAGESGAKLECGGREGLVGILLGLAPESIIVYDLSCGRGGHMLSLISRVFRERVRLFR